MSYVYRVRIWFKKPPGARRQSQVACNSKTVIAYILCWLSLACLGFDTSHTTRKLLDDLTPTQKPRLIMRVEHFLNRTLSPDKICHDPAVFPFYCDHPHRILLQNG